MKLRRVLRVLHRDFGYFITGMTVVYVLSGIFLNHRHDFNPDYRIMVTEFNTGIRNTAVSENELRMELEQVAPSMVFKKHYITNDGDIKIFIESGEVLIDPETGNGVMQYLRKRPLIFEMNKLHRATLGALWKWVSDIMGVILLFVAVSGLFILKGKRGFGKWGWWFTLAGIIVPLVFSLLLI